MQSRIFPFLTGDVGLARMMRTTWLTLFTDSSGPPQWLTFMWVAFVVAVTVAATIASRRAAVSSLVAMWLCVYFLAATSVWEHHYVMLLPGLVLLVALEPSQRAVALVVFVLVALPTPYALFEGWLASGPAEFAPETGWPDWAALVYHAAKPIPVLWLWSLLCWTALQTGRGEATGVKTPPSDELRSLATA